MDDGATTPNLPNEPQAAQVRRRYRVIKSRATVCDALNAFHDLDLDNRTEAILGRIPLDTEIDGVMVSIALSQDLTAHGIQITWPLEVAPHAGVVGYVERSAVVEVAL